MDGECINNRKDLCYEINVRGEVCDLGVEGEKLYQEGVNDIRREVKDV